MASYSKEQRKQAFIAYKELRSLAKTSEVLSIPLATLNQWSSKYEWQKKIEEEQKSLIPKPIDHEYEIKKLSKQFGLQDHEAELLKQIKTIEAVIFSTIYKRPPEDEDNIQLRPVSFDSAMRALKMCWDSRDKLFAPKDKVVVDDKPKVNYIAQVVNFTGNKEEQVVDIQQIEGE